MSAGSPHSLLNDPTNSIQYINAGKSESEIPTLVVQKIDQILDEYYSMKPEKLKRENEMKILFSYNKKLVETVEQFIAYEKKLIERYNQLTQLYIASFEKYCSSKSWDVNFNIKPIKSHFDKFSLKDWKFEIEDEKPLQPQPAYSSLLMTAIKRYFLNGHGQLEKLLDRISNKHSLSSSQQGALQLQEITLQITELNAQTLTPQNMFDLLERRKNIECEIRQIQEDFDQGFFKNDMNFVDEIKNIHAMLFQAQPAKLKEYLKNEHQIRRKLKKRSKACWKDLEQRLEVIEQENADIKMEIEQERRKREEIEKEKDKIKSLYDYLQIKSAGQTSRKDRNGNVTLAEDIRNNDPLRTSEIPSIILRETASKKHELRITQLETEVARLKTELSEREFALKKSVTRNQLRKDEVIDNLRKVIVGKLQELGMREDKQGVSVNALLEKLLERVSLHASSMSRSDRRSENVNIMIESVPIQGPIEDYMRSISLRKQYGEKQKDYSQMPSSEKREVRFTENTEVRFTENTADKHSLVNLLRSSREMKGSSELRNTPVLKSSREIKGSKQLKNSKEVPSDNIEAHEVERHEKFEQLSKLRKTTPVALPSADLLSISEKKSLEEDSKNIIDHSKHPSEDKFSDRNFVFIRPEQETREMLKISKRLQQENAKMLEEIRRLKSEVVGLEAKLSEKEKATPKSFISSVDLGKRMDTCQMQQIEAVCQSIAKELVKLEGNDFQKMVFRVQTAIKGYCNTFMKEQANINEIPVLSKTMQDDHLFKSVNIVEPSKTARDYGKSKLKASLGTDRQRSIKLALQSGEVNYLIHNEKSIYFGNKDELLFDTNKYLKIAKNNIVPEVEEMLFDTNKCLKIAKSNIVPEVESDLVDEENNHDQLHLQKEEDFIEIVANFEGMSRRKDKCPRDNLSENSLKYSIDQRDEELRSSLRMFNPKMLQETELLLKIERKIQEIKNSSDEGHDLYWFYRRYKQAMEALEKAEGTIRLHESRKEACLKKLAADEGLSKHKLEESIYFLQQRVKELENQLQASKEQYQATMSRDITDIEVLRATVLAAMAKSLNK